MKKKKFSLKARAKSFRYAFSGIYTLIKNEHNARIHLCVTIGVLFSGFFFELSAAEWINFIFAIGLVFSAEAFNSAIEYLSDLVSPEYHPLVKKAKDVAAAAVLLTAIAAALIGLIIFVPKILSLCSKL